MLLSCFERRGRRKRKREKEESEEEYSLRSCRLARISHTTSYHSFCTSVLPIVVKNRLRTNDPPVGLVFYSPIISRSAYHSDNYKDSSRDSDETQTGSVVMSFDAPELQLVLVERHRNGGCIKRLAIGMLTNHAQV